MYIVKLLSWEIIRFLKKPYRVTEMATKVDLLENVRLTRSCWGSSWEHFPRYRRHTWGHHADSFWRGC